MATIMGVQPILTVVLMERQRSWRRMFGLSLGLDGMIMVLEGLDVGVNANDDGLAIDRGFGGLVSLAAGDGERFARGGRSRCMQRDFDVEDVVLDGGFHVVVGWIGWSGKRNGPPRRSLIPCGGRCCSGRAVPRVVRRACHWQCQSEIRRRPVGSPVFI